MEDMDRQEIEEEIRRLGILINLYRQSKDCWHLIERQRILRESLDFIGV